MGESTGAEVPAGVNPIQKGTLTATDLHEDYRELSGTERGWWICWYPPAGNVWCGFCGEATVAGFHETTAPPVEGAEVAVTGRADEYGSRCLSCQQVVLTPQALQVHIFSPALANMLRWFIRREKLINTVIETVKPVLESHEPE